MNILQINASARREGANSTRVADSIVARLTLRDLAATPHPLLDEAALGALFTPAEPAARVALARGGLYRDTANDSRVPYLKSVLGFLGLTDVHFIYAEGLAMGPEAANQGFAQAEADLAAALA